MRFDEEADIQNCFDAAIKCWKILKPNYISLIDKGVNDNNIFKLCQYLL